MTIGVKGSHEKLFLSLFALAVNKGASVDYCEHVSGSRVWSTISIRDAFVDDITLVSFLSMFKGIIVHDSSHDSVKWDLNSNGIFVVKSFYMKPISLASSPIQSFL